MDSTYVGPDDIEDLECDWRISGSGSGSYASRTCDSGQGDSLKRQRKDQFQNRTLRKITHHWM
eukprot:5164509-Amphidinium_carterae.1